MWILLLLQPPAGGAGAGGAGAGGDGGGGSIKSGGFYMDGRRQSTGSESQPAMHHLESQTIALQRR